MKFIGGIHEGSPGLKLFFGILGLVFLLLIWVLLTNGPEPVLPPVTLPSPLRVITAFPELINYNDLIPNIGFSLGLNISGYIEAIVIAIPAGFLIGLIKYFRWSFHRQVDAIRFIALTALIGLFITWFGIGAAMKVHFLAFGILIYLLPVLIQRIDEVNDVYLKTVHTLGASDWQVLRTVYFPGVLSRLSDDIRVLTAISWTYIIVAEMVASQGGIGNLIWAAGLRQVRTDKVFALLAVIMVIGVIQDKIFLWLDRELFPFKHAAKIASKSSRIEERGVVSVMFDYAFVVLGWAGIAIYVLLFFNELIPFLGEVRPLSYVFGSTVWVIHFVVFSFLFFRIWKWWQLSSDKKALQSIQRKTVAG